MIERIGGKPGRCFRAQWPMSGTPPPSEVQQSLEVAAFDMRSQIIWTKDRFALSRGHLATRIRGSVRQFVSGPVALPLRGRDPQHLIRSLFVELCRN